jgi:hypothetical protein
VTKLGRIAVPALHGPEREVTEGFTPLHWFLGILHRTPGAQFEMFDTCLQIVDTGQDLEWHGP